MKNQGLNRRKFLQLGGTAATVSAISPLAYSSALSDKKLKNAIVAKEKIRLFSNENPYGPSKEVLKVISSQISRANRYASYHEYSTFTLIETIAQQNKIEASQIILGHGSFEILCMLARAFGKKQNSIIVPKLTFNVTAMFADKVFDHKCLRIPLTTSLDIDLQATRQAVKKDTQLVYICNPNNPTGKILSAKVLKSFCKEVASPTCTVAIDEAYIDLVNPSERLDTVKLLAEKYNVLIIRTFSKAYGLAGLRVGYVMGLPETIERMNSEHFSFGGLISNVGVAGAITALKDNAYINMYREQNKEVRAYIEGKLKAFNIEFLASATNFIYMKVKDTKRFSTGLVDTEVSHVAIGWQGYSEWARVSLGTRSEMEIFINTLSKMDWLIS